MKKCGIKYPIRCISEDREQDEVMQGDYPLTCPLP